MLNKVPEITADFWIIKVPATTVGETFADFLNINLDLGYLLSLVVFAVVIAVVALAYYAVTLYAVVAFGSPTSCPGPSGHPPATSCRRSRRTAASDSEPPARACSSPR